MAPISGVVGIDDDQRFALMKFRRSVKDILKPEHNDHFLVRWLRARQWDAEAAERMLRASMKWREKWNVDALDSWKAPEAEKYLPYGSPGFDKEGSPVVIVPFVGLDIWGLLHAATKTDMIRIIIRVVETYLAIARKQAETHGPAALKARRANAQKMRDVKKKAKSIENNEGKSQTPPSLISLDNQEQSILTSQSIIGIKRKLQGTYENSSPNSIISIVNKEEQSLPYEMDLEEKVTVIFDLDGFNIRQFAWKPATELVFSCLQMYEANYPEILKICYVVNAPAVFSLAFSIIKKFIHENTIEKIQIIGTDTRKWRAKVLNLVDKEQLPTYYGGTMEDDSGDPRCGTIINLGGKVPKSMFMKNIQQEDVKEYVRATVKTGDKLVVDLLCADGESGLQWDVGVENHDIKFLIKKREENGNESTIYGPIKLQEGPAELGVLSITGPATISVIFDNKGSYLRSKKVFYDIYISENLKELACDSPEDQSTAL